MTTCIGGRLLQCFISLLGGVWTDRCNRNRLILGEDGLNAIVIGSGIALLTVASGHMANGVAVDLVKK